MSFIHQEMKCFAQIGVPWHDLIEGRARIALRMRKSDIASADIHLMQAGQKFKQMRSIQARDDDFANRGARPCCEI
jgi:hypothetical protein